MAKVGDNAMGAGNQQGRSDALGHYVAGFVDGEGSFHVAVQRNPSTRWKWQVIPDSTCPRMMAISMYWS